MESAKSVRYIVYVSKATADQGAAKRDLLRQRRLLLELAGNDELLVVDLVEEDVEAIKLRNRPGLQAVIRAVERGEVEGILCEGLHRFGRSLPELFSIVRLFEVGSLKSIRTLTGEFSKRDSSETRGGREASSSIDALVIPGGKFGLAWTAKQIGG